MTFGLVKHNNNSISAITTPGNLAQGKMTFIKEQTASSSSSISFVDGSGGVVLDNTYPIYLFKFINIHSATDNVKFLYQGSTNSGSSYGITITSSAFYSYQAENGSAASSAYYPSEDLAQSTSYQPLIVYCGNQNDECLSGQLLIFNPSSTTFVKHFLSRGNAYSGDYTQEMYVGGYFNSTSALDAFDFKMSSGAIESGTIKLYGIKGS